MGVARSGLGVSLLPVGGGGHFEKAQRITDPPIHSSFLEMTPHEFYMFWKRPPQPIDVKTTNILATNSAEVHHINYLQTIVFLRFIWCLLFIAVTFSLNSPSLPALTYFHEVMHPFLKMTRKTNHARFWKWSPSKMAAPLRGNIRPLWLLPAPSPPPPPIKFHTDISVFAGSMVLLFQVNHLTSPVDF